MAHFYWLLQLPNHFRDMLNLLLSLEKLILNFTVLTFILVYRSRIIQLRDKAS